MKPILLSCVILAVTTNFSLAQQPPVFDVQPVGVTNVVGSTVTLASHATGSSPISYRWHFNLADATNSTSTNTIANAQSSMSGNYFVVATNTYGRATSSIVSVLLTNALICDTTALRAAINAGGLFRFGCSGTYSVFTTPYDSQQPSSGGGWIVSNSVTLDANGCSVTISGIAPSLSRMFIVKPGVTQTVSNIVFRDSYYSSAYFGQNSAPSDGGSIYNDGGTINLIGCQFINCRAVENNGGSSYGVYLARGGAIFNKGGSVNCFNTSFFTNAATVTSQYDVGQGGAIYSTSNGVVFASGCAFGQNFVKSRNDVCAGGAIYFDSGSVVLTNCNFFTNSAVGVPNGISLSPLSESGIGGAVAAMGGSLSVQQCQFVSNIARGDVGFQRVGRGEGAALYSAATSSIARSLFANNSSYSISATTKNQNNYQGGGIFNSGSMILNSSTIVSNTVRGTDAYYGGVPSYSYAGAGYGAGIYSSGQLFATNCTIALNSAFCGVGYYNSSLNTTYPNGNAEGAGVFNSGGTIILMNCTIASNRCDASGLIVNSGVPTNGFSAGDQIANVGGTLRLRNTLLAYAGTNGNAFGAITDDGYNFSSDNSAAFTSGSSHNSTAPLLLALANYGGNTLTMALASNSPAINSGGNTNAPAVDQRGYGRPAGNDVDAGAYEFAAGPPAQPLNFVMQGSTPNKNISFTASPGYIYRLQWSSNIINWNDEEVFSNLPDFSNIVRNISPPVGGGVKVFRILRQ